MHDDTLDNILEDERQNKIDASFDQEKLPEDNDNPAAPADDITNPHEIKFDQNHPSQDTGIDQTEKYDEG